MRSHDADSADGEQKRDTREYPVDGQQLRQARHECRCRSALLNAHARQSTRVRIEQVDPGVRLFVGVAGGEHHALADAELHLARCEVRNQHGQLTDQVLGLVGGLDAGEYGSIFAIADIER